MGRMQRRNRGNMDKINDLRVGMTFKNYKDLCFFMEAEVLEGTSKQYQLYEFAKYFSWTRQGQKYIITDVFAEPKNIPFMKDEELAKCVYLGIDKDDFDRAIDVLESSGIKVNKLTKSSK